MNRLSLFVGIVACNSAAQPAPHAQVQATPIVVASASAVPLTEQEAPRDRVWKWDGKRWLRVPGRYPVQDERVAAYQRCRTSVARVIGDIRHDLKRCLPHDAANAACTSLTNKALDQVETTLSECAAGGNGGSCAGILGSGVHLTFMVGFIDGYCMPTCDAAEINHVAQNVVDQRGELPRCGGVTQVSLKGAPVPGVVIERVTLGGPAWVAHLAAGDNITAINGTPVGNVTELIMALESTVPGDTVTLDFIRGGARQQTQATTVSASAQVSGELLAP